MTTKFTAMAAILALGACGASVPDSNPNVGTGVGFSDYDAYQSNQARARDLEIERARRDAELEATRGAPLAEERAIAQDTLGVLNETAPAGTAVAVASAQPQPVTTTPVATNPNISDEQDFDAVSSRESIESDRDRLARQSAAMQVVTPEAVPTRPSGNTAPNVVSYALSTSNPVGQPVHKRPKRFNEEKYRRACADFASSDQAQAAFLASGGPERDRRGLDPDGDGYACFWDPTPFRAARGG